MYITNKRNLYKNTGRSYSIIRFVLLLTPNNWDDYQLLDSGDGKRLEKFGKYILIRPDPQILWKTSLPSSKWQKADAEFIKISAEKGQWSRKQNVPEVWNMSFEDITFQCRMSPFKHTGVFPEQSIQWNFIKSIITGVLASSADNKKLPQNITYSPKTIEGLNILNLFGYTGIASLVIASTGAKVTHIDASFPTIGWARENQKLSKLENKPIRWILDDAIKFVQREIKRGVKYDGIIMDPPIYGHGPKGQKWDFNESFPELMKLCSQILSEQPLFVLINAYAISSSSVMLANVMNDYLTKYGGKTEYGELGLQEANNLARNCAPRILSTGIFARWSK